MLLLDTAEALLYVFSLTDDHVSHSQGRGLGFGLAFSKWAAKHLHDDVCPETTWLTETPSLLNSPSLLVFSQCARLCLKAWWRSWGPLPVRPPTPSSAISAERRRWVDATHGPFGSIRRGGVTDVALADTRQPVPYGGFRPVWNIASSNFVKSLLRWWFEDSLSWYVSS